MRKELFKEIEIPEGVKVEMLDDRLTVEGPEGEINRKFDATGLVFEKKESKIVIGNKKATKKEKKKMNTITAHIKNMIKGVKEKFEYKLKICFSHFPITVEVKENQAIIKNFLGEKVPRKVDMPKGVEVKVDRDIITISSVNKELAGQAAAKLESVTKVSMRDRRIFQDGIYIINKAGKEI